MIYTGITEDQLHLQHMEKEQYYEQLKKLRKDIESLYDFSEALAKYIVNTADYEKHSNDSYKEVKENAYRLSSFADAVLTIYKEK